jgi:hypothetical protein
MLLACACRWLGVDDIYMTENNETVPGAMRDALQPFVDDGFLHLDAWGNDDPSQMKIYSQCFDRNRYKYDWIAFIDADEYLMLLERCISSRPTACGGVALPTFPLYVVFFWSLICFRFLVPIPELILLLGHAFAEESAKPVSNKDSSCVLAWSPQSELLSRRLQGTRHVYPISVNHS